MHVRDGVRPLPSVLGKQIPERTDAFAHWNRCVPSPQTSIVQLAVPPLSQYTPCLMFYENPTGHTVGTAGVRTNAQVLVQNAKRKGLRAVRWGA